MCVCVTMGKNTGCRKLASIRSTARSEPHLLDMRADGVGGVVATDASHTLETGDDGGGRLVVLHASLVELVERVSQCRQPIAQLYRWRTVTS